MTMGHFRHNAIKLILLCGLISLLSQSCKEDSPLADSKNPIPFNTKFIGQIESPLSENLIYCKSVKLKRNSVIQSFDIAKDGSIYYLQIAGTSSHQLNLIKGTPADTAPEEMMVFEYFGHGTNMAIEEQGDGTWIWLGSYGNKGGDGEYGGSQAISRIKYEAGSTVQSGAGEHFYLDGTRNIHPSINLEKDILGVQYSKKVSGVNARFFVAYKLSEAMALEVEDVKLDMLKYGGENGVPEKTETPVIKARRLSRLTPLYSFGVSDGHGGAVGEYAFQGFDMDDKFVYYYEGFGNDNKVEEPSKAFVSVLDKNGLLSARKEVKAILDSEALKAAGIADRGYMEAEGIKVKGDKLYTGFASRLMKDGTDTRLANVFIYK